MDKLYKEVAEELQVPIEVVKQTNDAFWDFIRKTIKDIPLSEDMSEDEFSKYRTNFNVPSLGKFSCTYSRLEGLKKKRQVINKMRYDKSKKDKTTI